MIKKILIAFALVALGFLGFVALQSPEFTISRELLIQAPPEKLFSWINNSKKANEWMPWAESDPGVQMNYSGPEEGVGSKTSWDSKGKMGTGQAIVIESITNQSVQTQLTYTRPMEMSQLATVSLIPSANGTRVRWSVTGKNSFIGRIFCTFLNMDKMVGDEFDKGLKKLKAIVESGV